MSLKFLYVLLTLLLGLSAGFSITGGDKNEKVCIHSNYSLTFEMSTKVIHLEITVLDNRKIGSVRSITSNATAC